MSGLIPVNPGASDDLDIVECSDGDDAVVCLADVDEIGSDMVSALDEADGGDPGEMSSGSCARSASPAGPWSLCVVPTDAGQVVVGRDAGDELVARTEIDGADVVFPLANRAGRATVVNGRSSEYEVVDQDGALLGSMAGQTFG